ncbi:MAG: DUF115 domain-containing protein [Nitrospirae bacterium]|nr:DUF115 domain-containing protein [Nitrospirota bacterium]MBF0541815.1 DUF115 domain-containing protein [Nitrospirota bacterium]
MKGKVILDFINNNGSEDTKQILLSIWIKGFRQRNNYLMKDKLLPLKDKYLGKRAFILGNGPSLKDTDVRLLENEITIASNGIFFLFEHMGFLPTFYTVEDTLVAEDRAEIINNIRGTTKIFPYDLREHLRQDEETIYINFLRGYPFFPQISTNFASHVFWGGTVTFLNIQLAYFLGISEVYLIGFDHNYVVPDKDIQDKNVIMSKSPDANHFHPEYFGPGFRYHDPRVDIMEVGYKKVKEFCDKTGWRIYNATAGGRLEVFERLEFKSLF